jgi:hypothetical protein
MTPALGPSQIAILAWLKEHPDSTVSEVGDACYRVSYYGKRGSCSDLQQNKRFRAKWASRILQKLKKRGLVGFSDINNPKWKVVEGDKP